MKYNICKKLSSVFKPKQTKKQVKTQPEPVCRWNGNEFAELQAKMDKLNRRQKEIQFGLDEIKESIDDLASDESSDTDSLKAIKALVAVLDTLEDYTAYLKSQDTSDNISVLWNSAIKKIAQAELSIIFDEKTPIDASLNTVIATEQCSTIPEAYIIKTVRSGYIYKGKVLRKSQVIANAINKE